MRSPNLALLLVLAVALACGQSAPRPKRTVDQSPAAMKVRENLISKARSSGVIGNLTFHGDGTVWVRVRPAFYLLSFEEKTILVRVICDQYSYPVGRDEAVYLLDDLTNNSAGWYTPTEGLVLSE